MRIEYEIDDSKFSELLESMSVKERRKALMSVLRSRASALRRAAVQYLRAGVSNVRDKRALEGGIRSKVWREKIGFTVSAAPSQKRKKGFYPSRSPRRDLPVLVWLEYGTEGRYTRGRKNKRYTGRMVAVNYMRQARDKQSGIVTGPIEAELKKYIIKMAAKAAAKAS